MHVAVTGEILGRVLHQPVSLASLPVLHEIPLHQDLIGEVPAGGDGAKIASPRPTPAHGSRVAPVCEVCTIWG